MGSAKARPSHRAKRRRVVASTIQSAAAAALGLLISVGTLGALSDIAYRRMVDPLTPVGRLPLVIAVAVAIVALVPRSAVMRWLIGERCGWPVATAGPLIAATTAVLTSSTPSAAEAGTAQLMLALAGAVTLGGVLLAAAEATALLRLAISCGLAAGIAVGPLAFAVVFAQAGLGTLDGVSGVVLFGLLAVAGVAAAAADRMDPRIDLGQLPRLGFRRAVAPAFVAFGVLLLPGIAARTRDTISTKLRGGTVSEKRASLATTFDTVLPYAVVAAALILLIWYGYRRAGIPLVRLIVTGAGLGLLLPVGLQVDLLAHRSTGAAVVLVGAVGALAGVLLARNAPRWLPWDAIGLLVGAAGVVLLGRTVRTEVHSPGVLQSVLLVAGATLALGAALTPLLRSEAVDRPGTRTPGETVGTVSVGVTALVISSVLLGPAALTHITYLRTGFGVYTGPVTIGALALVLAGIFLSGLAMDRILRERAAANIAPPATLYRSTAAQAEQAGAGQATAPAAGRLATFEDAPPADDWDLPPSDEITMVGPRSPYSAAAARTTTAPPPRQWPPLSPELEPDDEPDDNDTGIMIAPIDRSRDHDSRTTW